MAGSVSQRPRWLRLARRMGRAVQRRTRAVTAAIGSLGPRRAMRFWAARRGLPLGRRGGRYLLSPAPAAPPLAARAASSDLDVFRNVFVERAYAGVGGDADDVRLVVDCGANVGYASAYFAVRYPRAELIAVEPDAANYEMLQVNTAPFGERVRALRAAVWSAPAALVIDEGVYGDGREWSRQVREARPGESDCFAAVSVETLLRDSGHERISILKVDIEGAEAVVFADGCQAWLPRVDSIAIELHSDTSFGDCHGVFHRAIAGEGFTVSQSGNLTICRRERAAQRSSRS
ncbi:MAG TPA: FkbM family methyltransferase [Solirubrobacteraceae bacterium]|nr:FkbM family methyltransferase [Solirubrobacteraceae bacterium]